MNRENRSIKITERFTPKEADEINAQFRKSTCREMSDYFRAALLKRKLTLHYRNQSLDSLKVNQGSHYDNNLKGDISLILQSEKLFEDLTKPGRQEYVSPGAAMKLKRKRKQKRGRPI